MITKNIYFKNFKKKKNQKKKKKKNFKKILKKKNPIIQSLSKNYKNSFI